MARSTARAAAMQLIFENLLGGDGGPESQEMVFQQLLGEMDEALLRQEVTKGDRQYIGEALEGVQTHLSDIDVLIQAFLVDWTLERISKVDLTILRLGTYEICHRQDVPGSVAINEAVELANRYSEPKSGAFINGVLGSILRDKEQRERACR